MTDMHGPRGATEPTGTREGRGKGATAPAILNFAAFAAESYWLERALALLEIGDTRLARKAETQANYWRRRIGMRPSRGLRILNVYPDLPRGPIRFVFAEEEA
jgi:hypothetical protein